MSVAEAVSGGSPVALVGTIDARQFVRMPVAVAGLAILVLVGAMALAAPLYIHSSDLDETKATAGSWAPPGHGYTPLDPHRLTPHAGNMAVASFSACSRATTPPSPSVCGPVSEVLRTAKAVEPEMAAVRDEMEGYRFQYMHSVVKWLARRTTLRVPVKRAAQIVWTLASPDVGHMLCDAQGWTTDEYAEWLENTLATTLLPAD